MIPTAHIWNQKNLIILLSVSSSSANIYYVLNYVLNYVLFHPPRKKSRYFYKTEYK